MFELVLRAPQTLVEAVSDALIDELDALAVSVEDADADSVAERPLFGEPGLPPPAPGWERSTLKALFETEAGADRAAVALLAREGRLHLQSMAELADQDWVRLTQAQFAPVAITPEFWIVPSWHEPPAAATRVIRLDPGLAFGTGTHPTTRMCLRWIARAPAPLARVLDYGCGSGILAIGAALHGATRIDAVDIDPAAVQSTRENAARNGIAAQTLTPALPDAAQGAYDLVLANILATPLKLLAPLLCAHVAPGGWLVLAGILERQADELRAAYAGRLELAVADRDEGWILMTAQRAGA
ncbi:MAG: 50S ribosomal protein L11 methyltransferase [Burkholderiales bacterium]|nr:50S ribosomal protein L11 methyltransferase [Burkholderiales bacterium]MDE1928767.1 50S ribosomal protein L11 methyltransferase [Burkholderiales bacterium]MDE2501654.1 50S ribosomal protein L11 methyltransferase [Burkholderiales bacterium]